MAEVVLFHHAQGLTAGVRAFADRLREAGHTVHTPDLFAGRTFDSVEEGVDHARSLGFDAVREAGVAAAQDLPAEIVYAGFSLGVMPAQQLAQTRTGARGALLLDSCLPAEEFGTWPAGLRAQVHGSVSDEWFEEDLPFARELAETNPTVELFTYEGPGHLFADSSVASYDEAAAAVLLERVLGFLGSVG
ncbi:dienelactone hydrolase family protein [Nocardioides marmoribigeumensis]|uniref:Dienelactone hydrolase n=1 Tax=Nocardioides marmoribigeumensis TaxID=433649 RepID=A0ABU2BXA7_9ACTN|nr:dienelactone hydrolase family protein [Nocardioides marmoribigeumensis]MDR7363036.1 dienelactone hydrolase [Nocardioides marmoribigeumensis]